MKYTLIVLSTEKNLDILPLFFQQFIKNWHKFNMQIILSLENNEVDSKFYFDLSQKFNLNIKGIQIQSFKKLVKQINIDT